MGREVNVTKKRWLKVFTIAIASVVSFSATAVEANEVGEAQQAITLEASTTATNVENDSAKKTCPPGGCWYVLSEGGRPTDYSFGAPTTTPCEDHEWGTTVSWNGSSGECNLGAELVASVKAGATTFKGKALSPGAIAAIRAARMSADGTFHATVEILD